MSFNASKIETGDCNLDTITMHKVDESAEPYSIFAQCEGFSIFEDLYRPVLMAEFTIKDSLNLLKRFPITGEEYISVSFNTPGKETSYSANLFVYEVGPITIEDDNLTQHYILKCCSQEFFKDCCTVVEKGYKESIDLIIKDILVNALSTAKQLNIGSTQGIQHIVLPRISPFKAIEMLRKRAVSPNRDSSSYVFYENRDGFNMTTVEDLIAIGTTAMSANPDLRTYYRHTALRAQFQNPFAHFDIVDYVVNQQFNVLDALKAGAYNGVMETFDLLTKKFTKNTYDATQFSSFASLDGNQGGNGITISIGQNVVRLGSPTSNTVGANQIRSVTAANLGKYGRQPGVPFFNFQDSSKPPTFIEESIPKKLGFLTPLLTSSYDIYINGDTDRTVGDVIGIQVPKVDKLTDQIPSTPDMLTNGNYIITKMRHNVLISVLKPKYTAIATVSKSTYN